MRRSPALLLVVILGALPLGGCVVAAVPVLAGAAIARSEAQRNKRKLAPAPAPTPPSAVPMPSPGQPGVVTVGDADNAALVAADFAPLLAHVRSRVTLWREGAPIKSLVLDDRQTVLNPIAIDCQRRQPVVLVDLDPAATGTRTPLTTLNATVGWPTALAEIRELNVMVIWITDRAATDRAAIQDRLILSALDPLSRDQIAVRTRANLRKHDVRLEQARSHCVLAVVGDKRGDADEAYDYLRSPDASLPIDSNWGAGWFILPPPLSEKDARL